jgi:hypothetical protein
MVLPMVWFAAGDIRNITIDRITFQHSQECWNVVEKDKKLSIGFGRSFCTKI